MNIDDLFNNYIKYLFERLALKDIKLASISTYIYKYEADIRPFFINIDIKEINKTTVNEFCKILLFRLSRKTSSDVLTLLDSILKVNNINIEIFKPKVEIPVTKSLTDDEWDRLEDYCIAHINFVTYCMLLDLYTGVRPGELCGSQVQNINFSKKEFHVTNTVERIKNTDENAKKKTKVIKDTPKSLAGFRTIPLLNDLCKLGKNLYKDIPPDCYILTGTQKYMEARTLYGKIKEIFSALEIRGSPYVLRHTFATNYYFKTNDIKILSELLGHKNIQSTFRYIYSSDEKKRQGINSLVQNR